MPSGREEEFSLERLEGYRSICNRLWKALLERNRDNPLAGTTEHDDIYEQAYSKRIIEPICKKLKKLLPYSENSALLPHLRIVANEITVVAHGKPASGIPNGFIRLFLEAANQGINVPRQQGHSEATISHQLDRFMIEYAKSFRDLLDYAKKIEGEPNKVSLLVKKLGETARAAVDEAYKYVDVRPDEPDETPRITQL